MSVTDLPTVNALLNGAATILLIIGYSLVRQRKLESHRKVMMAAFGCSIAFMASYLYYHSQVGSVKFQGEGTVRTVYLAILLTHSVLAAAVPFLASITLFRGLKERFTSHRKIARWTLPIWLYVSVTGVVIYWMLYQMDF